MSNYKTYKDQSREGWYSPMDQKSATIEQIQTGCLQRIADATEKMASNYTELQRELDRYKGYYNNAREQRDKAYRRISALQGVITKLKKKL